MKTRNLIEAANFKLALNSQPLFNKKHLHNIKTCLNPLKHQVANPGRSLLQQQVRLLCLLQLGLHLL